MRRPYIRHAALFENPPSELRKQGVVGCAECVGEIDKAFVGVRGLDPVKLQLHHCGRPSVSDDHARAGIRENDLRDALLSW